MMNKYYFKRSKLSSQHIRLGSRLSVAIVSAVILAVCGQVPAETQYSLAWAQQLGTSGDERGYAVAVDASGNAFLSGYTSGNLGGTNVGNTDAFLAKYDALGNRIWTQQIGTTGFDYGNSVAVDTAGNAYMSGYTAGSLGGTYAGGNGDAFLAKYSSTGGLVWKTQIGTTGDEYNSRVVVDNSGNAYISGWTTGSLGGTNGGGKDAYIAKYSTSGTLLWKKQVGTTGDENNYAVAVDSAGNSYISGATSGSLYGTNAGSNDAYLVKYDTSGNQLWKRQIGTTAADVSYSVAVDSSGNAYISGGTSGNLGGTSAGGLDACLIKYDTSGNLLWTRQLGTSVDDYSYAVAVNSSGNVYITGSTSGSLGGTNAGSWDTFMVKYDASGNQLWSRQIGTAGYDYGTSIAVDSSDKVYISGYTSGSLGGTNAGGSDAFLVKYEALAQFLAGDADKNNKIDGADLLILNTNWDPLGVNINAWEDGDFDGNGKVDGADLLVLNTNWAPLGYTLPSDLGNTVPEPITMAILAVGGLTILRRRAK